jgi:SLAP domain-containing protein
LAEKKQSFLARWLTGAMQPDLSKEESLKQPVEAEAKTLGSQLPHTLLVFTDEQQVSFSDEQKETYKRYLSMMPSLPIGQVNFIAFEAGHYLGGYYVRVFIRHARDLEEEFTLGPVPLSLVDHTGDVVAKGAFQPQNFGTLRFGETRVWTFAWRESEVLKREPDFTSFTIRFE